MDLGFKDKHVLITGSSGGIGSSITDLFLENDALVSGIDIKKRNSNNLKNNKNFYFKEADLESESDVKSAFHAFTAERGRIDSLVLAHGFWFPTYQAIKDLELERWNKVITSNLTATMLSLKYFFQNLEQFPNDEASIVLLGSTAGMYGLPGFNEYAAVKAALVGLLKTLKVEILSYAPQGRVNLISPGIVKTSMSDVFRSNEPLLRKTLQVSALAKVAQPDDVASMVLILTSYLTSGHVTGENIFISGGLEGRIIHDFDKVKTT